MRNQATSPTVGRVAHFTFDVWLSFCIERVALILHWTCRSHFTLDVWLSFAFDVWLSFCIGRVALILHCRVALICIRRNPNPNPNLGHEPSGGSHSHTVGVWLLFRIVMWLTLPYSCRVVLISHCHVALISIVGRFSFCNVMWLSFYIVVWLSFPLISSQGLYFGTRLYRPYRLHGLSRVQATAVL